MRKTDAQRLLTENTFGQCEALLFTSIFFSLKINVVKSFHFFPESNVNQISHYLFPNREG